MKSYEFSFGILDIFHLLFKKKMCHDCKEALKIKIVTRDLGKGKHIESDEDGFTIEYSDKTVSRVGYICPKCDREYILNEL